MRHELIIGGTGGQGVITIGYAIAEAAAEQHAFVTRFPIYMATMRGGPAFCTVIFADEEIAAPIISRADNAIAMESGSYSRFKKEVKPGGRLFVNSSIVKKIAPGEGFEVYAIPVNDLAQEMGAPGMANMIMLGAYREVTQMIADDQLMKAINKTLSAEGAESKRERIAAAYAKGAAYLREHPEAKL